MTGTLKISLKANEKIYVNGAVIKSDRKVTLEFLNNVQFLMENHVLQAEDARTPLRQLYFAVQVMLISPEDSDKARAVFTGMLPKLLATFSDERIRAGLKQVDRLVGDGQVYEALKEIRALYPLEEETLKHATPDETEPLARAVGE